MIDWQIAFTVAVCAVAALILWWFRDRRLAEQRSAMRALYALSEEIISARSPSQVLRQLLDVLPRISEVTGVRLYLLDLGSKTLSRVPSSLDPDPLSVTLDEETAVATCARNRTALTIPDTARSPLYSAGLETDPPKSAIFVPMLAEDEVLGVLELDHSGGVRRFNPNQRAAAQHLANQVGTTLKLQAQHSMREQLSRSEKLAAAGKLISGVLSELKEPLGSVAGRTAQLSERTQDESLRNELEEIAAEARRASDIVARLVKFSPAEPSSAAPVDIDNLLGELIALRDPERQARGIQLRNLLSGKPLTVLGDRSQLEQVFLNLLMIADRSLEGAAEKTITIDARRLAERAVVEIAFSEPVTQQPTSDEDLGLAVCRGIVQSHGGGIRSLPAADGESRIEIELPLAPAATREPAELQHRQQESARRLTVLVVESESIARQRLMTLLSSRGHRVVPAGGTGEAMDFAQRLQFEVVFSSSSLPGANWVDFYDRIRHLVSGFVLLTEGHAADISRAFQAPDSFVLSKPVDAAEFDQLMRSLEASATRRTA